MSGVQKQGLGHAHVQECVGTCLHKLACDALQLSLCEVLGIAAHAAFGTPKGNVYHGRLPCCQARQTEY